MVAIGAGLINYASEGAGQTVGLQRWREFNALSPKIVTRSWSPPKLRMFFCTHCSRNR